MAFVMHQSAAGHPVHIPSLRSATNPVEHGVGCTAKLKCLSYALACLATSCEEGLQ